MYLLKILKIKIALSTYDNKRIQLINSIETYAYETSKDLTI